MDRIARALPPHVWFGVSALFHYLGPSFAVLLFPTVGVLGVAWLRIASAALVFSAFVRPRRVFRSLQPGDRVRLVAFGLCLAAMNCCFYQALARLPISLVAAIEFVGTLAIALYGVRTLRNLAAFCLVAAGVLILVDVKWMVEPVGLAWAVANGILFVGYIVAGHRLARAGASDGVARLGAAMVIAFVAIAPLGLREAARAFAEPWLLLAGCGVGVCSSVIPYVCDQLAMSRLPRATFSLLLALLPATATLVGALVLHQIPSVRDLCGIAFVMSGVAFHRSTVVSPERGAS